MQKEKVKTAFWTQKLQQNFALFTCLNFLSQYFASGSGGHKLYDLLTLFWQVWVLYSQTVTRKNINGSTIF